MTCKACGDQGFVTFVGDFKSSRTDIVTKAVEQVRRCPEYVRYFQELQIDLGIAVQDKKFSGTEVVRHHRVTEPDAWKRAQAYASEALRPGCGAAVARHREVVEHVRAKASEKAADGKVQRGAWR